MRALPLAAASLLLAACSGAAPANPSAGATPPAAASPAPSATPSQPLAALVDFPTGTGAGSTGYDLSLVAPDGRVAAHIHPATRTATGAGGAAALDLPEVSAANGRVYY